MRSNRISVTLKGVDVARFSHVVRVESFAVWPEDPYSTLFGHHVLGTYDDTGAEKVLGSICAGCDWRFI